MANYYWPYADYPQNSHVKNDQRALTFHVNRRMLVFVMAVSELSKLREITTAETVRINVPLPADLHYRLKLLATSTRRTLAEVIIEAGQRLVGA